MESKSLKGLKKDGADFADEDSAGEDSGGDDSEEVVFEYEQPAEEIVIEKTEPEKPVQEPENGVEPVAEDTDEILAEHKKSMLVKAGNGLLDLFFHDICGFGPKEDGPSRSKD